MANYHVAAGAFGIYAGILKNKYEWKDKTECTDEAIEAVRDFLVDKCLGGIDCKETNTGGYQWTLKDGRTVELRVTIKDKE